MKKRYGIVSYNIHGNYTNYGSILQSFALQHALELYFGEYIEPVVLDYFPDVTIDSDPLNPLKKSKNVSDEFRRMIELSMPAIKMNYFKTLDFIKKYYKLSNSSYNRSNFSDSFNDERLEGYIVGSDAVWMIDFFGKDQGFWAEYEPMKHHSTIAYAVSCGESNYTSEQLAYIKNCLGNFNVIGVRESKYMDFFNKYASSIVRRVVDPTLLLTRDVYLNIQTDRLIKEPYILLYSRKYNPEMERYTDQISEKYGLKVVEISLRAQNSNRHIMKYSAGVEEFLSLIYHSENVVTNSLHATIFSIIYHRPVSFFARDNAGNKVIELLDQYNLQKMIVKKDMIPRIEKDYDFESIDKKIENNRRESIEFLGEALKIGSVARYGNE